MIGTRGAGLEVDVGGGIEFGGDDVNVVAAHAGGECCESVAVVGTRKGVDFAVEALVFDAVEKGLEHLYTRRVADEYDIVGEGVCGEVYMVEASVGSQNQFAGFIFH